MRLKHPNYNPISWFNWLRAREFYAFDRGILYMDSHYEAAFERMKKENRRLRNILKEHGIKC